MALTPFVLPKIQAADSIVDGTGRPTTRFLKFFNFDFARAIERNDNQQAASLEAIQAVVDQLQVTMLAVQQAQAAANQAQETADGASGSGTVSGFATDDTLILVDNDWTLGPVVSLTGVVAGNLTITGTAPQQSETTAATGGVGILPGQFRVVEVIGGIDEILFTGAMTLTVSVSGSVIVRNDSVTEVGAFISARASTGAVDYRIDVRLTGTGRNVSDMGVYLYARRAA